MSPTLLARLLRSSGRLLRAIDPFDAWRSAATDAALALAAWKSAGTPEKADAYAAYRAALDREAHAARLLEVRLVRAAA